jgi:D-alanine transaminase
MSRIAYVNGRYVPHGEAQVHVEDRGYQFADGVYEVVCVRGGRLVDEDGHLVRLERSLRELRIAQPMRRSAIEHILREMVRRNRIVDGLVYMQVTRGVARRDHPFPKSGTPPAIVMTAKATRPIAAAILDKGVAVLSMPDTRWERCDIKSVSLLPNILSKQTAREAGAYEAWLIDDAGMVTEGSSTNAWIVTAAGEIVTRQLSHDILGGITRASLMVLAQGVQLRIVERPFSLEEAYQAAEAFITSASSFVMPVVKIDGRSVGRGVPGPVAQRLRQLYMDYANGEISLSA